VAPPGQDVRPLGIFFYYLQTLILDRLDHGRQALQARPRAIDAVGRMAEHPRRIGLRHRGAARGPSTPSFDHLVSEREQLRRDFETECLGGLEIDNQFDLRGLLDRQVGRLLAF
jgi:hypothetical protein